jgi:flagellar motor protein MotB
MRITPEGFVISLNELGFFNSGQAVLLPGAAQKIQRIAKVLSSHGLDLRVEGHSDNQPIHTAEFRSNWELSTARAMNVMSLLVDSSGFDPGKDLGGRIWTVPAGSRQRNARRPANESARRPRSCRRPPRSPGASRSLMPNVPMDREPSRR